MRRLEPLEVSSEIQFMTMARAKSDSMLVEVKAIGNHYPLYGNLELLGENFQQQTKAIQSEKIAWVQLDILERLHLKVGDAIELGSTSFTIRAQIQKDSVLPQASLNFAPRIYIAEKFVVDTHLIQYGSQIFHRLFFKLNDSKNLELTASELRRTLADPNLVVRTPHDAIEGFNRFLEFFTRYLSVITVVVFCIAWMSAFYIFQSLNQSHLKQAAIVMTLGGSRTLIAGIYLLQSLVLSICSFVIAGLFSLCALHLVANYYKAHLPQGFEFQFYIQDFLNNFLLSILTSFCFVLSLILKISRLNIQILLGENNQSTEKMPWVELLALNFSILTIFMFLSYHLMGSQAFAMSFVFALAICAFATLYFGRVIFWIFKQSMKSKPGVLRVLSVNLARIRFAQTLCFIAIALIAVILNVVPHLMKSIKNDIDPIVGRHLPSLFLFNIPDEKLEDLKRFASENHQDLQYISPLILARLTSINNTAPKQEFLLKFPVRVSYRKDLIDSEKIIAGKSLPIDYHEGDPIYVSLDQGFAERVNLQIGDELQFDVAGIAFKTIVRNLRSVRWSDFNPNFFFQFQTGVLEDAPKTWIANMQLDEKDATKFANRLSQQFPDVSIIDVRKSMETITQMVGGLIVPVEMLASLSAILCLLIMAFVIWHHLLSRTEEIEVVKILGASSSQVSWLFIGEYIVLALCALGAGSLLGFGMAYFVCLRFLKIEGHFAWSETIKLSGLFLALMLIICSYLVTRLMSRAHSISIKS